MTVSLLDKWTLNGAIRASRGLSSTAKVVAGALLDRLNCRTLQCNPSIATLGDDVGGLSRSRTIAALKELEEREWITVERLSHEAARGRSMGLPSNCYAFNWARASAVEPIEEIGHDTPIVENNTRAAPPSIENATRLVAFPHLALVSKTAPKHGNSLNTGIEHLPPTPEPAWQEFAAAWSWGGGEVIAEAKKVFAALRPDEQRAAIKAAPRYERGSAQRGLNYRKFAKTWLRERGWEAPPVRSVAPLPSSRRPGEVLVEQETPQWAAWARHHREILRSVPPYPRNVVIGGRYTVGAWFPSEWPPERAPESHFGRTM